MRCDPMVQRIERSRVQADRKQRSGVLRSTTSASRQRSAPVVGLTLRGDARPTVSASVKGQRHAQRSDMDQEQGEGNTERMHALPSSH